MSFLKNQKGKTELQKKKNTYIDESEWGISLFGCMGPDILNDLIELK